MDCGTPGFPVHHQLPEPTQTQVHWVGDAIQQSHPLSSPSPPAFNLSQHQSLFQGVSSSHQVAKVLEFQLQHQSFQWIFRIDLLQDWLVGSPYIPRDSQESSPTPQFKSISSSALSLIQSNSHLVMSKSLQPQLLYSPWKSLGQSTGVGSFSLWKVVAEPCKDVRIISLWRRKIKSGARDEAWSLRAFM